MKIMINSLFFVFLIFYPLLSDVRNIVKMLFSTFLITISQQFFVSTNKHEINCYFRAVEHKENITTITSEDLPLETDE